MQTQCLFHVRGFFKKNSKIIKTDLWKKDISHKTCTSLDLKI